MESYWEKLVRRYVWSDERTPYLTRVGNLTRVQAHFELAGYAFLMCVLFGVLSIFTLSTQLPHGNASVVPIYSFTVCCAALILGFTKHVWAALWCAGAPIAALAYFSAWGFHPNLDESARVLLVVAVLAWLAYSGRLIKVAQAWREFAEPD